jgi:hypothetical protein
MKTTITSILAALATDITSLVDRIVIATEQKFERKLSDWDKEMIQLNVILDMVKSVEKYTANDDKLVSVSSSVSIKGNLQINAVIERNGIQYSLTTEVIYAGGHRLNTLSSMVQIITG